MRKCEVRTAPIAALRSLLMGYAAAALALRFGGRGCTGTSVT